MILQGDQRRAAAAMLEHWERFGRHTITAAVFRGQGVSSVPRIVVVGQLSDEDYLGFSGGKIAPDAGRFLEGQNVYAKYRDVRDLASSGIGQDAPRVSVCATVQEAYWAAVAGEPLVRSALLECFWQELAMGGDGLRGALGLEVLRSQDMGYLKPAIVRPAAFPDNPSPRFRDQVALLARRYDMCAGLLNRERPEALDTVLARKVPGLADLLAGDQWPATQAYPIVRKVCREVSILAGQLGRLSANISSDDRAFVQDGLQQIFWKTRTFNLAPIQARDLEDQFQFRDLSGTVSWQPLPARVGSFREVGQPREDDADSFVLN